MANKGIIFDISAIWEAILINNLHHSLVYIILIFSIKGEWVRVSAIHICWNYIILMIWTVTHSTISRSHNSSSNDFFRHIIAIRINVAISWPKVCIWSQFKISFDNFSRHRMLQLHIDLLITLFIECNELITLNIFFIGSWAHVFGVSCSPHTHSLIFK